MAAASIPRVGVRVVPNGEPAAGRALIVRSRPNVHLGTAACLLDVLGLPADDDARRRRAPADDFLGRVLLAQGPQPADLGMPPVAAVTGSNAVLDRRHDRAA